MSQLVCLSNTPWNDYTSRTRQIMSRLHRHRVLFFDPPPAKSGNSVKTQSYKDEGQQVAKWITSYSMPPMNKTSPLLLRRLSEKRLAGYVQGRMGEVGVQNPVLWISSAEYLPLLERIPHEYAIIDIPSSFTKDIQAGLDNYKGKPYVILCQSAEMRERLKDFNDSVYILKNGVDFKHFNSAATGDLPFPNELFNVKNPILGLVGKIDGRLELGFIEHAAKEHPEWSFVLIGEKDENADLSRIEGLKNVYLTGYIEQKLLPRFLSRFDACLHITGKSADAGASDYGVLCEYMSAGKPIVATPRAGSLDYPDVVYIAGTPAEFTEQCKKAIGERDAWKVRQRIAYGSASSWDARIMELERILREKGAKP